MFFFSKSQSFLGVDLGAGSIKVVEFKNDRGRARLVTYGFAERKVEAIRLDFIEQTEEQANLLKKICEKARTSSRQVIAALPISAVFSAIINVPAGASQKDIASAIKWEAKKIVPLPLEEMILDWKPLPSAGKEKARDLSVLLTATAKNLVQKYLEIFKKAGLELISLETESFALIRSLVGLDKSPIMIVDAGAARSSIVIVEEGIPYLNRSIDVAGINFTKVISENLGLSLAEAEQFKFDLSISGTANPAVQELVKKTANLIFSELQYCLDLYHTQQRESGKKIEKIILTGGSALLPGFVEFCTETLKIKAFLGDPWARVMYPEELQTVLEKVGPKFSVAIGLAMRDIG